MNHTLFQNLNEKQKKAATAPNNGILQIMAGPGTGKTKVLVSRVAYLLLHEQIPPQNIIVTTFTKKAANEMIERLRHILKNSAIDVHRLLIGTFHSISFRIIQKYGSLINLSGYTVADEKDSLQILLDVFSTVLTDLDWATIDTFGDEVVALFRAKNAKNLGEKHRGFDPAVFKKKISSLKASGILPQSYLSQKNSNPLLALVFCRYQETLGSNKLLDFDDCLLYCHQIIANHHVLNFVRHTLVDEFQDTNEIQLQMMYLFARAHRNVTVVGDPDQSIYAFRDAQSTNFNKMKDHYSNDPSFQIITLDQNYRSTSDILDLSEKLMRQQVNRAQKNLKSQLESSIKPIRSVLSSSEEEARWIAHHISYLCGLPECTVEFSDIAILVRSAYQTRAIESELVKRKIPYFMVKGRAFWERKEVTTMMDYLRCVAFENDTLAIFRSLNFPKRGFGPKAMSDIEKIVSSNRHMSTFKVLTELAKGSIACSIGPKLIKTLGEWLKMVDFCKEIVDKDLVSSLEWLSLLDKFFSQIYLKSGVSKEFETDENRGLNIQEMKNQLIEFKIPPEFELPGTTQMIQRSLNPFLKESPSYEGFFYWFLSTDTDPKDSSTLSSKVSISTIHGAKGLEWPVVFVPGVSEGLLPASFALTQSEESVDEERRCFYVATTRAKSILLVSSYIEGPDGGKWGRKPIEKPSRFLKTLEDSFLGKFELSTMENFHTMRKVLQKPIAQFEDIDFNKISHKYVEGIESYVLQQNNGKENQGFISAGKVEYNQFGFKGT